MIVSICKSDVDDDVNRNCITLLGFFGQLSNFFNELPLIGEIFVSFLKDESLEVVCETLNSIFDVFAEPNINKIFSELNMMKILIELLNKLEKINFNNINDIEMDEESFRESLTDLQNFIKYKQNQKF